MKFIKKASEVRNFAREINFLCEDGLLIMPCENEGILTL